MEPAMGNTNTVSRSQEANPQQTQHHQKDHDQPPPTNPNKEEEPQQEILVVEDVESPTFTCEICIEPMLSNNRFNNENKCVHPFCMDCMTKYIQVKVEDDAATDVECPGLNCKQLLDPMSCRPLIAHQVFDKWCDNLCESAVLGLDKCYCPYQDCSALVVNECGEIKGSSKCPNCKKLFCFHCKMPWHAGYRCDESDELRDGNDVLFGQLLERENWTRCPGCGHSIERIAGCRIVKCRCKTSFCYDCGAKRGYFHHCPMYQPSAAPEGTFERIFFVLFLILVVIVLGPPLFLFFLLRDLGQGILNTIKATRKPIQQPNNPNSSGHV